MADTLEKLKLLLAARDEARIRLVGLEARAKEKGGADNRLKSEIRRQAERLSAMDEKAHQLRDSISRNTERARTSHKEATESLASLHALHGSGGITEEAFSARQQELAALITDTEEQVEVGTRAMLADSASDLDWLATVPAGHRPATAAEPGRGQKPGEMTISEFPGASVPERIAMLWRESKKPQSRRSVLISTAVVAIFTVLVFAVVLISGHFNPKSPTDYLGKGEVLVPVLVDRAENVRNLEFTLQYDPAFLSGMSVVQGDVGRLAVMQYDIHRSGKVEVLLRDITGIDGSGSIVVMRFRVNDFEPDPTPLTFVSLKAVDSVTLEAKPAEGDDGWIDTLKLDVLAPVVRFP